MSQDIKEQAGKLLNHVAGFVGMRTIEMGLSHGLFAELAKHPEGISLEQLATKTGRDPFYVKVWAQAAYGAEVIELEGADKYKLAPHMETLLLNEEFPGHVGGIFKVLLQPEMFDTFSKNFVSGERLWWDKCSPEFITAVSNTGRPFYNRMIPDGFEKVPGLKEILEKGGHVLELCCGAGRGLTKLVQQYPNCTFTGLDGDAHSLEVTGQRLKEIGLSEKVSLVQSPLEDIDIEGEFDVVFINISMHECRDIDKVTQNLNRALKTGGIFVISDFPFPEDVRGCRTVPARVMCGIQYFEALIDDQLLPTQAFVDLLGKHGFKEVGCVDVTPVHAITWGRK